MPSPLGSFVSGSRGADSAVPSFPSHSPNCSVASSSGSGGGGAPFCYGRMGQRAHITHAHGPGATRRLALRARGRALLVHRSEVCAEARARKASLRAPQLLDHTVRFSPGTHCLRPEPARCPSPPGAWIQRAGAGARSAARAPRSSAMEPASWPIGAQANQPARKAPPLPSSRPLPTLPAVARLSRGSAPRGWGRHVRIEARIAYAGRGIRRAQTATLTAALGGML